MQAHPNKTESGSDSVNVCVPTEASAVRLENITRELQQAELIHQQQTGQRGFAPNARERPWTHTELPKAAAHARLEALFDSALNAILLADDTGAYVDANPAACAMLGFSREELLHLTVQDLLAEAPSPNDAWQRFIGCDQQVGRTTLRRKDGSLLVADYMATTHIQPGLHLSVLEDASARVQTEQSLDCTRQQLQDMAVQQQERLDELRAELAHDLHDELGQLLGALRLEVDLVADVAPGAAQRMRTLLGEAAAAVRDLSRAQRPPNLDLGLVPALRALAVDFSRRGELDIGVNLCPELCADLCNLPPALATPVVLALFRVAQEALSNAVRHAAARHITLSLKRCGADLMLCVEDDGRGFDTELARHGKGLGLVGMRERASRAGARFDLRSQPGKGTRVTVSLSRCIAGWAR